MDKPEETPENPTPRPATSEAINPQSSLATTIFIGADGLRAGWGLLFFFTVWYLLSSGAAAIGHAINQHLQHGHPAPRTLSGVTPGAILFGESYLALSALLATWLMARIERRPIFGYGLAWHRWLPRLLAGLAWGFAFLSLLIFMLRISGLLIFDGRLLFGTRAFGYGVYWFAAFLMVGFFEEIFFRGYVQFTLARGLAAIFGWLNTPNRQALGFWTAAFLISFGFGFTHSSNAGESPIGLVSAGLIGVVFCLSLWRTGSLWWAIGLHASWDWAQSYVYGVADSGNVVAYHLLATHPVGKPILSGGLTGPEGSIYILPIVLLIIGAVLQTLPPTNNVYFERSNPNEPAALDLP